MFVSYTVEDLIDAFAAEAELESFERMTRKARYFRALNTYHTCRSEQVLQFDASALIAFEHEYDDAQCAYRALCDRAVAYTIARRFAKARVTELRAKAQRDARVIRAYRKLLRAS